MPNITNIPAPRVPIIDNKTGLLSREWYLFFLNLFILTGSGTNDTSLQDVQVGPPQQDFSDLLVRVENIAPAVDNFGEAQALSQQAQLLQITDRYDALISGLSDQIGTLPPAASGSVTSVDVSGGSTGLTASGGPILTAGTITLSGTLNALSGGTGHGSYAVGDLLYADSTSSLARLADVATGNALISGGIGVAPAWGKVGLTTHVTGVLPAANGGTGLSALGSGIATWLGTPSSANLAAAVTDETGTGALVFANTPTLVTPVIGAATGTSVSLSSTATASAFIPSGSSVPSNGMYLPASNTLGFATNSGLRVQIGSTGTMIPGSDASQDLGSSTAHWSVAYTTQVQRASSGTLFVNAAAGGSDIALRVAGTNILVANSSGVTVTGTVTTSSSGSGAGAWKLGVAVAGVGLTLKTTEYVEVNINGTTYKLAEVL